MRKLLRYEIGEHYFSFVVMSALYTICMFIIVLFLKSAPDILKTSLFDAYSSWLGFLFVFAIFGAIISILGLFVVQVLMVINTFGKNLFGRYGYLLFSLPIEIDKILLAKVLSCFVLIGASICYYVFVGIQVLLLISDVDMVMLTERFLKFFVAIFRDFTIYSVYGTISVVTYIFGGTLQFLMQILLTLALLNIWRITSFRLVLGVLLFFVINFCCGLAVSVPIAILHTIGVGIFDTSSFLYMLANSKEGIDEFSFWVPYAYFLTEYLIISGACYLLARYCVVRKMELE